MLPSHEFQDSIKLMHIFINPDPGELILQPSARSGVGAASRRGAAGARLGLRPGRAAAPARSPLARLYDPRLARTDAPGPKPSCPPSPPLD